MGSVHSIPFHSTDRESVRSSPELTIISPFLCISAGCVVHVPPGWVHTVYTKAPCVKVAIEVFQARHMQSYLRSWAENQTKTMKPSKLPTTDYMRVGMLLCKLAPVVCESILK